MLVKDTWWTWVQTRASAVVLKFRGLHKCLSESANQQYGFQLFYLAPKNQQFLEN